MNLNRKAIDQSPRDLKLIILIVLTALTSVGLIISIGLTVDFAKRNETFVPGWRATHGLITNITTHNVTIDACVKSDITVLTPLCNNTLFLVTPCVNKPIIQQINETIDCFVDPSCTKVEITNDHPDKMVLNENDTYSFYMGCTGLVLLMCLYSLCTLTAFKLRDHWNEKELLRTLSIDRIPLRDGSRFSVV